MHMFQCCNVYCDCTDVMLNLYKFCLSILSMLCCVCPNFVLNLLFQFCVTFLKLLCCFFNFYNAMLKFQCISSNTLWHLLECFNTEFELMLRCCVNVLQYYVVIVPMLHSNCTKAMRIVCFFAFLN
jgi:hypothetical protein